MKIYLITLSTESNLLAILHAFVDLDFKDLAFAIDFPAVALLAAQLRVDPLALTLTFGAHCLDLLHHPRAKLLDTYLHSGSSACRAALNCACFATNA